MNPYRTLFAFLLSISSLNIYSQDCNNDIKFPATLFDAPTDFDTLQFTNINFAGDYLEAHEFIVGETYMFTSSEETDFITIRTFDRDSVLVYGAQPLQYTINTDTAITIHFNTPGCGSSPTNRTTKVIHTFNFEFPNIGINTMEPLASLDVNGTIKVANDSNTPAVGMIRYNEDTEDFEGYDGTKWRSFTKPSAVWGDQLAPTATTSECLTQTDAGDFAYFGAELDIDGNWLAVAATSENIEENNNEGAIYMYEKTETGFVFRQKLTSPSGSPFDAFGSGGIDLFENYLIVGIPNADYETSVGKVDIWDLKNGFWSHKATIGNGHPNNDFHFGSSVSTNGTYAAVQNSDLIGGVDQVFIYKRAGFNWNVVDTLVGSGPSGTFGSHLEWYEGQLFVGDSAFSGPGVVGGQITIYNINANDKAILSSEINNPGENTNFNDDFGWQFDLQGDRMIVASEGYSVNGVFRSGQAYIYLRSDGVWSLEATLRENPTSEFSDFGRRVSIYNDQAVVSITGYLDKPGKSYVYKFDGEWQLEAVLEDGNQTNNDFFGKDIEIDNNVIISGASRTDVNGIQDQGKVYLFCK